MNKTIKATIVLFIYLVTITIGGLTIVNSKWNECQMFTGVCLIALTFFLLVDKRGVQFCYTSVKTYPTLCIGFGMLLTLMFMPIFYTLKHGVVAGYVLSQNPVVARVTC